MPAQSAAVRTSSKGSRSSPRPRPSLTRPHPALPRKRGRGLSAAPFECWRRRQQAGGMHAGRGRKANDERAALAALALLECEGAAVAVGQFAADEEAETGAWLRSESGIVDAEKA